MNEIELKKILDKLSLCDKMKIAYFINEEELPMDCETYIEEIDNLLENGQHYLANLLLRSLVGIDTRSVRKSPKMGIDILSLEKAIDEFIIVSTFPRNDFIIKQKWYQDQNKRAKIMLKKIAHINLET